jgi:hypothetical protein
MGSCITWIFSTFDDVYVFTSPYDNTVSAGFLHQHAWVFATGFHGDANQILTNHLARILSNAGRQTVSLSTVHPVVVLDATSTTHVSSTGPVCDTKTTLMDLFPIPLECIPNAVVSIVAQVHTAIQRHSVACITRWLNAVRIVFTKHASLIRVPMTNVLLERDVGPAHHHRTNRLTTFPDVCVLMQTVSQWCVVMQALQWQSVEYASRDKHTDRIQHQTIPTGTFGIKSDRPFSQASRPNTQDNIYSNGWIVPPDLVPYVVLTDKHGCVYARALRPRTVGYSLYAESHVWQSISQWDLAAPRCSCVLVLAPANQMFNRHATSIHRNLYKANEHKCIHLWVLDVWIFHNRVVLHSNMLVNATSVPINSCQSFHPNTWEQTLGERHALVVEWVGRTRRRMAPQSQRIGIQYNTNIPTVVDNRMFVHSAPLAASVSPFSVGQCATSTVPANRCMLTAMRFSDG